MAYIGELKVVPSAQIMAAGGSLYNPADVLGEGWVGTGTSQVGPNWEYKYTGTESERNQATQNYYNYSPYDWGAMAGITQTTEPWTKSITSTGQPITSGMSVDAYGNVISSSDTTNTNNELSSFNIPMDVYPSTGVAPFAKEKLEELLPALMGPGAFAQSYEPVYKDMVRDFIKEQGQKGILSGTTTAEGLKEISKIPYEAYLSNLMGTAGLLSGITTYEDPLAPYRLAAQMLMSTQ